MKQILLIVTSSALLTYVLTSSALAQQSPPNNSEEPSPSVSRMDILTPQQWQRVDKSIEQGLSWLDTQQQRDGSYLTIPAGQPGITGLAVMAFLAAGYLPGEGPYGKQLERAVEYVLHTQNHQGLFSYVRQSGKLNKCIEYNHAIAGLMLGEVYGMCNDRLNERIHPAIERGLAWTISHQNAPKTHYADRGGWRYYNKWNQSDLSLTSWQIMFLRSAKNARFNVSHEPLKEAIGYVERCFDHRTGAFYYEAMQVNPRPKISRGMAGSGILTLSLAGKHNHPMAKQAGEWMLRHSFRNYNRSPDPYHYAAYYASQAMFQLGGKYWEQFFPEFAQTLVQAQRLDGSWEIEQHKNGIMFGSCYTTSLVILALTTPYQLLPIYQR